MSPLPLLPPSPPPPPLSFAGFPRSTPFSDPLVHLSSFVSSVVFASLLALRSSLIAQFPQPPPPPPCSVVPAPPPLWHTPPFPGRSRSLAVGSFSFVCWVYAAAATSRLFCSVFLFILFNLFRWFLLWPWLLFLLPLPLPLSFAGSSVYLYLQFVMSVARLVCTFFFSLRSSSSNRRRSSSLQRISEAFHFGDEFVFLFNFSHLPSGGTLTTTTAPGHTDTAHKTHIWP